MMKVLWVTHGIMPVMLNAMGKTAGIGGGWLDEPARLLAEDSDIQLTIASSYSGKELIHKSLPGMEYYLVPEGYMDRMKNPSKKHRALCKRLLEEIEPDLIHLHGSEFAGALSYIEQFRKPKLLSIQGLISKINSDYFYGGIKMPSWLGCIMPWNVRSYLPIKLQHTRNKWRARAEIRQIEQVDAVIGCTRWDYVYSKKINSKLRYYNVGYAIRKEFLEGCWDLNACEKHTIMVSSMAVPLKGMHKAIEALALLREKYPDAKIKVTGYDILGKKFKYGYSYHLYKKAKKLGVLDAIEILGPQDVYGMINTLKSSHTFLLSSFIENGPNSMMEAMYVGVPCVCSYVGGAMQFAKEGEEAIFYRFEETEVLAYEIDRIWQDDELALKLSQNARRRAKGFETFEQVYLRYKEIYAEMIDRYKR